jgi:peroxiredoxin Q/BCP
MVSVDDLELNTKFAKEHEADFPILADPEKTVANAYGVLGPSGLARRWTFYIGGDGKILYIEKKVAPATAGDDLAAKLGELADKGLIKRKK